MDIDQTYNGGLFSPQESEFTRFIEETRTTDRYLAETLFNITTYHERNGQERPISYRDMSVRHLGTLYEGLLEHKLFITKEETEVRVAKGKIEFIPLSHGGRLLLGQTLAAGVVYFGSDQSERKSSGSYFTPEDVVDYVADVSVGEKLQTLKADFLLQEKNNLDALAHSKDETERKSIANLIEENAGIFVREKILSLSVLDPAMGSGHFLVNVTNLIANFITEFLNEVSIYGETPTGTSYWRRWVVENCIFGVDLNPLAVELAKLSLWILSMAKDQPLSFMNHHLKCGNSLVGARLENVGVYPHSKTKKEIRQLSYFDRDKEFKFAVENAVAKAHLIAEKGSISLDDVSAKKAWLDEIENVLKIYKLICNVHTNLQLGSGISEDEYTSMINQKDVLALSAYESETFIHWELEFPEIMLKNHGFDIIIGNPPYANIPLEISRFVEQNYATYNSGDLYTLFIEKLIFLNKQSGYSGFVLPLSLTFSESMQSVRQELITVLNKDWKVASFDRIPDALFGGNVRTRNSILIGVPNNSGKNNLFTTPMYRWFAREREQLFSSIQYININEICKSGGGWAKIGSEKQVNVLSTLFRKKAPLSSAFSKTNKVNTLYFSSTAYNWLTVTKKMPPVYDLDGNLLEQTKYGSLQFETENDTWFGLSI
ncbi:hypothetical protein HGB07_09545, partial [Candidatus Roizmanbacteria bacterium]|nr:hypothetical protein [Candidatus Roizmanbacteria bacterium]